MLLTWDWVWVGGLAAQCEPCSVSRETLSKNLIRFHVKHLCISDGPQHLTRPPPSARAGTQPRNLSFARPRPQLVDTSVASCYLTCRERASATILDSRNGTRDNTPPAQRYTARRRKPQYTHAAPHSPLKLDAAAQALRLRIHTAARHHGVRNRPQDRLPRR